LEIIRDDSVDALNDVFWILEDSYALTKPEFLTPHDILATTMEDTLTASRIQQSQLGSWSVQDNHHVFDALRAAIAQDEMMKPTKLWLKFDSKEEADKWLKENEYMLKYLPNIKNVVFNNPATIIFWEDGTKTIVKAMETDVYDPEFGFAMCICKKALGDQYKKAFKKYVSPELKKAEMKAATKCDAPTAVPDPPEKAEKKAAKTAKAAKASKTKAKKTKADGDK
jgi:hypothetical protein